MRERDAMRDRREASHGVGSGTHSRPMVYESMGAKDGAWRYCGRIKGKEKRDNAKCGWWRGEGRCGGER